VSKGVGKPISQDTKSAITDAAADMTAMDLVPLAFIISWGWI